MIENRLSAGIQIAAGNGPYSRHWVFRTLNRQDDRLDVALVTQALSTARELSSRQLSSPDNFVVTLAGSRISNPEKLGRHAHVYLFRTREEKFSALSTVLATQVKISSIASTETDLLLSTGVGREPMLVPAWAQSDSSLRAKLEMLQDVRVSYATRDFTLVSPDSSHLGHLVCRSYSKTPRDFIRQVVETAMSISESIFGNPGHFALTYNGRNLRSLDGEYAHIEFFPSRADKLATWSRAVGLKLASTSLDSLVYPRRRLRLR